MNKRSIVEGAQSYYYTLHAKALVRDDVALLLTQIAGDEDKISEICFRDMS
jgi:hypothetical protein